jgi:hypothetical protein
VWFQELVAQDEVSFEAGVFLLRKATAEAVKSGQPGKPGQEPVREPESKTVAPSESGVTAVPGVDTKTSTKTLRLLGKVPPEVWNRLGTKILPKLRTGLELKIGLEFSVTVPADTADGLAADLRQILQELGLGEAVRVE